MATPRERAALLAVKCDWCGSGPGTECVIRGLSRRRGDRGPRTLDGRCHDARWMAALGRPAPVLADRIQPPERRAAGPATQTRGTTAVLDPPKEAPHDRPW